MSELKRKIAVIGMVGRFPMAENTEQFWENLKNGKDCITRNPESDRKNFISAYGQIPYLKEFDAEFFEIYPKKARNMDPGSKIMMELTKEVIDNAGIRNESSQDKIGLYLSFDDAVYVWNNIMQSGENWYRKYHQLKLYLASRCEDIAYYFKFKGPAVISEYAYASAITSIHQACLAIRNGDCEIALAGAVSADPEQEGYNYITTMSSCGITRPYDKNADGFVPSSAAGIVALKDFEKAVVEHDNILAVIDGTFINNDGRGTEENFAAPSVEGRVDCIENLLRVSGKSPDDINYFEGHGTATKVGDEVEINALRRVFDTETRKKNLLIGSVKSNIGHSGVASGICNFIKTVLMLKNRTFLPTINFSSPNSCLENSKIKVCDRISEYSQHEPFTVIASSVGLGGANAMALLEEYSEPDKTTENENRFYILPISAKTADSAKKISDNLENLVNEKKYDLSDVEFTLQTGREEYDFRTYLVAGGGDFTVQKRRIIESDCSDRKKVFVFSGSTNVDRTVGKELYMTEPVFREYMNECFECSEKTGINGMKKFFTDFSAESYDTVNDSKKLLILMLSIGYSMTRTLIHFGIRPDILMGHSSGEYCAAVVSGIMTLEQAMKMLSFRHELFYKLPEGGMINVFAGEEKIRMLLADGIEIGAVNAPGRIMLTGRKDACDRFENVLRENNIVYSRMQTSFTGHSSLIDNIKDEYYDYIKDFCFNKGDIKVVSSCMTKVSGNNEDMFSPEYWVRQMRLPVMFSSAVDTVINSEKSMFIEVGVSDTLTSMIRKHKSEGTHIPAFAVFDSPVQKNSSAGFMGFLGEIWSNKIEVKWEKMYTEKPYKVPLVSYPFERKEYWSYKPDIAFGRTEKDDREDKIYEKETSENQYTATGKYLTELFENILGSEIKLNDDLYLYGLDSLGLMNAVSHINEDLNLKIRQSELNDFRTTEEIKKFLSSLNPVENAEKNQSVLKPLKPLEEFFKDF